MTPHLTSEQLLRHLDGEMSASESRDAKAHLASCLACQFELEELTRGISLILEAQTKVFEPSLPPPPKPWPRLEARLDAPSKRRTRILPSSWIPLKTPRFAYGAAAVGVALIAVSLWVSLTPASAKEVLSRAVAADNKRFAIDNRQAVRQAVRVKKTSRTSALQHTVRMDAWKSSVAAYWQAKDSAAELLDRYRANGLGSDLPLSPSAVESWLAITGSEPVAARNADFTDVHAAAKNLGNAHGLEQVSVRIERQNWHIDQMTLSFDDATYEVAEEETKVIARSEAPPEVRTVLEATLPARAPVVTSPRKDDSKTPPDSGTGAAPALDDLEMGVRFVLHRTGTDLGEGVEVTALPPNQLRVDARQARPEVKDRLLQEFAGMPGVVVEVDSSKANVVTSPNRTIRAAESSKAPEDPRLLQFFGSADAEENYTRLLLEQINDVLTHLYAIRSLAQRWPTSLESSLSAGSRAKLEIMLKDHVKDTQSALQKLVSQLQDLMKTFGSPPGGQPAGLPPQPWQQGSSLALEAAQQVDRLARSVLTLSDQPLSPDQAFPQLQQSLSRLYGAIQSLSIP